MELQQAILALGDLRGRDCWDLGAHYGLYSIGLARHAGPDAQIVALEPNPVSFARLNYHRRLNRLPWLDLCVSVPLGQKVPGIGIPQFAESAKSAVKKSGGIASGSA